MSHRLTVEDLNVSNQYCPNQIDLTEWPHLEGMDQPNIDVEVSEVSVLIGQDVPQAHVVLHYCWCDNPQSQPYALITPLDCQCLLARKKKKVNLLLFLFSI